MIRVTVEMVPKGNESRRYTMAVAEIANDCSGTKTKGSYVARLSPQGKPERVWKRGVIRGFPRTQMNVWHLVLWALLSCGLADRYKT